MNSITCFVCTEYFDRNFVTFLCGHSYCSTCEPNLKNRCAICRHMRVIAIDEEDKEQEPQDPELLVAVLTRPRTMECGDVVEGVGAGETHVESCVKCMRMTCEALKKECRAHVRSREKLEEDYAEIDAELLITQGELKEAEEENRALKRSRQTLVYTSPQSMVAHEDMVPRTPHVFFRPVARALFT